MNSYNQLSWTSIGSYYGLKLKRGKGSNITPIDVRSKWLDDLEMGNNYNKTHAFDYQYRELYIENSKGGYFILDGYTPSKYIVSRKFTQLNEVSTKTAIGYIEELARKYPENAKIANVPSSGPLAGKRLQGQLILEVPIQRYPIPKPIIDAANSKGIIIRDVYGNEYN